MYRKHKSSCYCCFCCCSSCCSFTIFLLSLADIAFELLIQTEVWNRSHNDFTDTTHTSEKNMNDRILFPSTNLFPEVIVQDLCESRGGRPGLSVLTSLLVSVDVKNY